MTLKKKKLLPSVKKKLTWFLTDESGKITKKDVLWLWISALLVSFIPDGMANCSPEHWSHANHANHANGPSGHMNQWHGSWYQRNGHLSGIETTTVNEGNVKWHYSGMPNGWHQSGYIRWGHVSQGHANDIRHGNTGTGHGNTWSHCSSR